MKLFKTISLEERLKNSPYNDIGQKPQPVDQGSVQLKLPVVGERSVTAQLKITPSAAERNSEILKIITNSRPEQLTPTPVLLQTNPLQNYNIPLARTDFRSAISLSDRLKQTSIGTTNHLPQFFLSDFYANYIDITPFGIFQHASDTIVQLPISQLSQGGVDPTFPIFDSLLAQGTSAVNGVYTSFTNVLLPIQNILLYQGTFFSNGIYFSQTNTQSPVPVGFLPQGGVDAIPAIGIPSIQIQQGIVVDVSVVNVAFPTTPSFVVDSIIARHGQPNPTLPILDFQNEIVVDQGIVIIPTTTFQNDLTITQGGLNPTTITFSPEIKSPTLKVIRYEADRALAVFAPRVKHGSADLIETNFSNLQFDQGTAGGENTQYQSASPYLYSKLIASEVMLLTNPNTFEIPNDPFLEWIDWQYGFVGTKKGIEYIKKANQGLVLNPNIEISSYLSPDVDLEDVSRFVERTVEFPDGQSSLSSYLKVSYGDIAKRVRENRTTQPAQQFSAGNPARRGDSDANSKDFITFSISSARGAGSVRFKAYLTSMSDSFAVSWNDINYVGRQDTLKAYKGMTRSMSIGFKMAAMTKGDLDIIYGKLNSFARIAAVGDAVGNYVKGPICTLTVGGWITGVYCVFNSIKVDTQPSEYSWDIDKGLPHIVDVSFDCTFLTDNGNNLLNGSSTFFG